MKTYFFVILFFSHVTLFSQTPELNTALKNKGYNKVILLGFKILDKKPEDFDALLNIGRAYNALNEFSKAIPFLEKARYQATIEWQWAWVYVELMEAYYATGDYKRAKEFYKKALNYRGTQEAERQFKQQAFLFGFEDVYKSWIHIEMEHIIFHFQSLSSIKSLELYMREREKSFTNINQFYKASLPKKIDFYVWDSANEAKNFLGKTLGFTNPKFCVSHNKTTQTKGHEIAHSISFWFEKSNTRNRFINEGIGVYFDQRTIDRVQLARVAMKYCLQPLDVYDMWLDPYTYSERSLYPVAGAFVEVLIKYDKSKFLELSKHQDYYSARRIYGEELDALIRKFNSKINQKKVYN